MNSPSRLADLSWPEVARLAPDSLLAIPLGATEQHGPHLPFTVDTELATELAERLARRRGHVVVAPAVPYGSSGEHAAFPGTLSIGRTATELIVLELVRSAACFRGVLLVCGHGGNAGPVNGALRQLRTEGRPVLAWAPAGDPADSHAGRLETSAMLRLRRRAVRMAAARPGDLRALASLMPTLRAEGVAAVSPDGVLGDPTTASSRAGEELLSRWAAALLAAVDDWWRRLPAGAQGRAEQA